MNVTFTFCKVSGQSNKQIYQFWNIFKHTQKENKKPNLFKMYIDIKSVYFFYVVLCWIKIMCVHVEAVESLSAVL